MFDTDISKAKKLCHEKLLKQYKVPESLLNKYTRLVLQRKEELEKLLFQK